MKKNKSGSKSVEGLAELRKELRIHARTFKADMKDEWRRVEKDWELLQRQILPARRAAEKSASDVKAASEHLLQSVKRGYARIKQSLAS